VTIAFLAAGSAGHLIQKMKIWERILVVIGVIIVFLPLGIWSEIIGLLILASVLLIQIYFSRFQQKQALVETISTEE